MPRFFVGPEAVQGDRIALDEESLRHIRVLRLGPRETFTVCDGAGRDYQCLLAGDAAEIQSVSDNLAEPSVRCTVYAAYAKGERMDYAVQKSVELGAMEIRLFPAARCVARYDDKSLGKKLARWEKIALEAAKQAGRGMVPKVTALPDLSSAIRAAVEADRPLFFYEDETRLGLRQALDERPDFQTASLVTGPEGGFDPDEVELARGAGLRVVTLGRRILRCETAPAAALAAVMFYSDNL